MNIILSFSQKQMDAKAKATGRFLILLFACASWISSYGQAKKAETKTSIQLADQYFAAGEYYTAANLYEQYLNPPKNQKTVNQFPLNVKGKRTTVAKPNANASRSDILYKQAESYRLANYWQQAAACYKKCIDKDVSENPGALYWYAVCERSLGHYDSATQSLNQYLNFTGNINQYKDDAQKELQTLTYIQQQLARPDSVLIKTKKIDAPGSFEKGVFALSHVSGNQFL